MLPRIAAAAALLSSGQYHMTAYAATSATDVIGVLDLARDFLTATDIERFADQFSDHASSPAPPEASRRSLQQGGSVSISLPPITDNVSPEAHNGWLDGQTWRTFQSAVGKPGSRNTKDVDLHYVTAHCAATQTPPCSRGGVVLVVGHGEPVDKYAEQIFDLLKEGFSPVYALDHRGQGRSSRLLTGSDAFKSHVEESSDFITDFRDFVKLADAEMKSTGEGDGKRFLQCHSMGCAIALTYLLEEYYSQRPNVFNAVAANAPLIKPVTSPFPYEVAVAIGKTMLALGFDTSYPPTKGASEAELYCSDATCTAPRQPAGRPDRQLIQYARCHAYRNVAYDAGHSGLCIGDLTARFASEFFGMFSAFDTYSGIQATKNSLAIPIRIQQARSIDDEGKPVGHDGLVINTEQERFCDHVGSACSLTRYPEAEHNIWFEKDTIRGLALAEAYGFYDQHAATVAAQKPLPQVCSWWQLWCGYGQCDCVWSCSHPAASC